MKNTVLIAVVASVAGFVGFWVFSQISRQENSGQPVPVMMISSDSQTASPNGSTALEDMQRFEAMHRKVK